MNANENLVPTESKLHIGGTAPVGSCAIRPTYSDGHAGGHYSWDDRNDLGDNALWKRYLERLQAAGASRDRRDHYCAQHGCAAAC